ncbi:MAG: hypothetical protein H7338_00290 [Candidatus Sericytochromatia bacterium]|nr:hypothetical protein [Candidatus Sericytochromatia bacterium]
MKPTHAAIIAALITLAPVAAYADTAPATPDLIAQAKPAASDAPATAAPTRTTAAASTPFSALQMGQKSAGGRNITAFDRPGQRGVGGYFSQEFTAGSDGKIYFDQRQLVMQTSAYLHDNLFFNAEVEYEHGADTAKGGEISIEQAWGEYSINDSLNLRAGILLIPLGRLNVFHDADYREATTRPLAVRQIVPSTWFGPGIGARGVFLPNDTMEISYEAYLTQGLTDQISAANGLRDARPQMSSDNNAGKAISSRVAFSPWLGMEVGVGGYFSPYDTDSSKWLSMGAVDLLWRNGPFELVGEASLVNTPGGTFKQNNADVAIPTMMGGYYLEGHYSFFPEVLRPTFLGKGLGFNDARFTAFARFGQVDTDFSQLTDMDRAEVVLGLNYRPVPNTALKVEWQRQIKMTGGATDAFISSLAMGF